jgi:hypothetical protein
VPIEEIVMAWIQTIGAAVCLLLISQVMGKESVAAKLHPNTYQSSNRKARAENAIDGRKSIVGKGICLNCNCSSTDRNEAASPMQYLEVDLGQQSYIAAVKLHLRDDIQRRIGLAGLVVKISNTTIKNADQGSQCGKMYGNNNRFPQSPVFRCWKKGQYAYAILSNFSHSLQVCEMQVFKKINLTSKTAEFIPNEPASPAKYAIDGRSNIGQSAKSGSHECAGMSLKPIPRPLECLRVDLEEEHQVYAIRLHLRDGKENYEKQRNMLIDANNEFDGSTLHGNCGYYNPSKGQSPTFYCSRDSSSRYVWISKRYPIPPISVCEIEVYSDVHRDVLCPKPKDPPNGTYKVKRHSLTLVCDKGFTPSSPEPATCLMSGNWSHLPICTEIRCLMPQDPPHGRYIATNVTVGSNLTVVCEPGYTPSYCNQTICLINGSWSQPLPLCEPVYFCGNSCSSNKKYKDVYDYPERGHPHPWHATICLNGLDHCGGALVSPRCILTLDHCVPRVKSFRVCLGHICNICSNSTLNKEKSQCFPSNQLTIRHYNQPANGNIAIVKLPKCAELNCTRVYPVCLPNENRDTQSGVVIGWGEGRNCLRKGIVSLTSSPGEEQTGRMTAKYGNSHFKGYNGDPLIVKRGKRSSDQYVLAGLTSQDSDIITKITSEHTDWIKEVCEIDD